MTPADVEHPWASLPAVVTPYLGVLAVSFLVSFILTPLMRSQALRYGVVDRPDLLRKNHKIPIAYLGGIAIFLAWLAGMFTCFFIEPHDPRVLALGLHHVAFPITIVIGALVIVLTGLMDDVFGIGPRVKIGGQLFAAAALAHNDVGSALVEDFLTFLGYQPPDLLCYIVGAAIIAIFVLGGCNSINLMDGMDGLAGGVTAIATLGFLFISLFSAVGLTGLADQPPGMDLLASPLRIVLCLALLGAILGFLPYNFHPANIFMGDSGSLLLGYLSVCTILMLAHVPAAGPAMVMAALIVFSLPIMDTLMAIVRRRIAGRPIFSADNQHLHHQLLRRGLSVRQATLTLYGVALLLALFGCSIIFLRGRYVFVIFLVQFISAPVLAYLWARRSARLVPAIPCADAAAEKVPGEALPPSSKPAATRAPVAS